MSGYRIGGQGADAGYQNLGCQGPAPKLTPTEEYDRIRRFNQPVYITLLEDRMADMQKQITRLLELVEQEVKRGNI